MVSAGKLFDSLKGAGAKIAKSEGFLGDVVARTVPWGLTGAALGGGTEWAQGGSFWEGAKQGAMTGAMVGAGIQAYKTGFPKFSGAVTQAAGESKSVTALRRLAADNSKAKRLTAGAYKYGPNNSFMMR